MQLFGRARKRRVAGDGFKDFELSEGQLRAVVVEIERRNAR
jgi:hypothetical protein